MGVTIKASLGISCAGNCEVQNNLATNDGDISVGGGLEVFGSVAADGSIHVGQWIKVGDSLSAGGDVSCNGNCNVRNSVTSVCGDLLTLGYLTAGGDVRAGGNIQAGRWIGVGGQLHAGAFIKAGECVVGEQGIVAGADYGILAGLCIPRSEWDQRGYVSSKKRPRNIISGHFVAGVNIDKLVSNRGDTDGVPIG